MWEKEGPLTRPEPDVEVGSPLVGKLLYRIQEKTKSSWTSLEFYEHVLVYRSKEKWCCFPGKYNAEAVPRFKIVNVTFTNGRRNQCCCVCTLFTVGLALILAGCFAWGKLSEGGKVCLILFGTLLFLGALIPLSLCKKFRYVTIDVKGNMTGAWFSMAKSYSFCFYRVDPDEVFIIDYVFGSLRKGSVPIHTLSHLNAVNLASPMSSDVRVSYEGKL